MTLRRIRWDRIAFLGLLVLARPRRGGLRGTGHRPGRIGFGPPIADAGRRRSSRPQPGADPISFLAWIFTPIFKAMFIILVAVYDLLTSLGVPAAIGWAIVALTLVVRIVRHPALPAPARVAAPDAAPPARDQGDPAALQGRFA